jgi:tetratricopeptide (TPR) repeat protein
LSPDNVLAHYNLGLVLTSQENIDGAMSQYRSALKIDPNYANAYFALALLYQAQNNVGEATTAFHKYLDLDPTGPYSEQTKTALARINLTTTGTDQPAQTDPGAANAAAQQSQPVAPQSVQQTAPPEVAPQRLAPVNNIQTSTEIPEGSL